MNNIIENFYYLFFIFSIGLKHYNYFSILFNNELLFFDILNYFRIFKI
jgi:hypothetical protein